MTANGLTSQQTYSVLRRFLETYYETSRMPSDVAQIYDEMELMPDGRSRTPMAKERWQLAIERFLEEHRSGSRLSPMEAYSVAQSYLDHYYFDLLDEPPGLGGLLGEMELAADGVSMDPAAIADWMRAVNKVLDEGAVD